MLTVGMPHFRGEAAAGRLVGVVLGEGQARVEEASLTAHRFGTAAESVSVLCPVWAWQLGIAFLFLCRLGGGVCITSTWHAAA